LTEYRTSPSRSHCHGRGPFGCHKNRSRIPAWLEGRRLFTAAARRLSTGNTSMIRSMGQGAGWISRARGSPVPSPHQGSSMTNSIRMRALPLAIAALLVMAPLAAQNVTTSGVNGRVLDAQGQPVAGATVTILHEPSGTAKTVTTDTDGRYAAQGLRVGGPFEISVSKAGIATAEQDNVYLQLGQPSSINLSMGASAQNAKNLAGVTVSASSLAQTFSSENKGLSTNISQRQLQATPQGNRSIDDVARLDPRITVLDQGVGAISANGMNNRYNNISVDGVTQGDPFGLNANGLPYQKAPISPETIAEYNISTANFDVISDTVGADINAVTKSGTNQFHGSIYYAYRNARKLVGDAGWLPSSDHGYNYHGYGK